MCRINTRNVLKTTPSVKYVNINSWVLSVTGEQPINIKSIEPEMDSTRSSSNNNTIQNYTNQQITKHNFKHI